MCSQGSCSKSFGESTPNREACRAYSSPNSPKSSRLVKAPPLEGPVRHIVHQTIWDNAIRLYSSRQNSKKRVPNCCFTEGGHGGTHKSPPQQQKSTEKAPQKPTNGTHKGAARHHESHKSYHKSYQKAEKAHKGSTAPQKATKSHHKSPPQQQKSPHRPTPGRRTTKAIHKSYRKAPRKQHKSPPTAPTKAHHGKHKGAARHHQKPPKATKSHQKPPQKPPKVTALYSTGMEKRKARPWGLRWWAEMVPLWKATAFFTMDKPRPEPSERWESSSGMR